MYAEMTFCVFPLLIWGPRMVSLFAHRQVGTVLVLEVLTFLWDVTGGFWDLFAIVFVVCACIVCLYVLSVFCVCSDSNFSQIAESWYSNNDQFYCLFLHQVD